MTRYSAHGLRLQSSIPLDAKVVANGDPDFVVTSAARGRVSLHGEPVPGEVLAHHDDGAGSSFSVWRAPGGAGRDVVTVCFHGVISADIDLDARTIRVTLAPSTDTGLAPVFLAGTVLAVVLTLTGHPVLHASAVLINAPVRQTVGFVGRSGMGKSTAASLMCRDGAKLMTDDVLRLDTGDDGSVTAWPGATSLRLRENTWLLGRELDGPTAVTADGRLSVSPEANDAHAPLAALVVPRPDRDITTVTVEPLPPVGALLALAGFPRILGWTDPTIARAGHEHLSVLVNRVPVLVADIPWGPPFRPGLGSELADRVLEAASRVGL